MTILQMKEAAAGKAKEYHNILDNNKGTLSTEESEQLTKLEGEITDLENRIKREEFIVARESDNLQVEDVTESLKEKGASNKTVEIFQKWMKGGDRALSNEDWQHVQNAMSTTTDGEGGYTVQEEVAGNVIEALKKFGGMRQVATVVHTSQGNPMNFPTTDGTSEEGEILGENQQATDSDVSFGIKNLPVFKYSSKVIPVPFELLQDSNVDVEALVNKRIATRIHRITNKHFTVGTGTNQPLGLVAGAGVGVTAAAAVGIQYDELVELEHSVDPAYRELGECGYMFGDDILKLLKKMKDSQNRPLWLPKLDEGAPATILGNKYTINQHMAAPVANAKSIIFGDFSSYVIRDVMELTFFRFTDSFYSKKGQVGFLAFMRSGGNLLDVGGSVKVLQQKSV